MVKAKTKTKKIRRILFRVFFSSCVYVRCECVSVYECPIHQATKQHHHYTCTGVCWLKMDSRKQWECNRLFIYYNISYEYVNVIHCSMPNTHTTSSLTIAIGTRNEWELVVVVKKIDDLTKLWRVLFHVCWQCLRLADYELIFLVSSCLWLSRNRQMIIFKPRENDSFLIRAQCHRLRLRLNWSFA